METMLTSYKFFTYQVDIRTFNNVRYFLQWTPKKQSLMTMPELNDHIKLCSIDDTDNWVTQEYVIRQIGRNEYSFDSIYYLSELGED